MSTGFAIGNRIIHQPGPLHTDLIRLGERRGDTRRLLRAKSQRLYYSIRVTGIVIRQPSPRRTFDLRPHDIRPPVNSISCDFYKLSSVVLQYLWRSSDLGSTFAVSRFLLSSLPEFYSLSVLHPGNVFQSASFILPVLAFVLHARFMSFVNCPYYSQYYC